MVAFDWEAIEKGTAEYPCLFDFYATGDARQKVFTLLDRKESDSERKAMLELAVEEMIRVYCAYRKAKQGRGFGLGKSPAHEKMRQAGREAAAHMLDKSVGPADVLFKMNAPQAPAFLQELDVIPWHLFCSGKFIDCTNRRTAKRRTTASQSDKPITHSYSRPLEKASVNLRSVLVTRFGKEAIDDIATDDGNLFVKVEARARELSKNPRLFVPAKYKHIVQWYMQEHVEKTQ